MIYRAYRYPYEYVPQEPRPKEVEIKPIDNTTYRVPGAGKLGAKKIIDIEGTLPYYQDVALCVATDDEGVVYNKEKIFTVDTDLFKPVNSISEWYDKVLNIKSKPVLVLFGAERGTHCKALHPILEEALEEEFKDLFGIRFVNVDENSDIIKSLNISGIPVVAVFKNGEEIKRFNGERDYDDLCDFLDEVL
ncbi:thioredoxin [Anaerofustis stercorihominis DSM 17244]|uniref:Thioredoxin n=1 Tax=Anaerofustis stercorihominis DSM 17244 TaxID=445971 RepID=B1CAA6_9FIRM|nr:thioredoxin [Anaerofustis stercorihominis DSM 17244]